MPTDRELLDSCAEVIAEAIINLRAGNNRYEIANDLALVHGHITITQYTPDQRRRALRVIHNEEWAAEVARGEHDDREWSDA